MLGSKLLVVISSEARNLFLSDSTAGETNGNRSINERTSGKTKIGTGRSSSPRFWRTVHPVNRPADSRATSLHRHPPELLQRRRTSFLPPARNRPSLRSHLGLP